MHPDHRQTLPSQSLWESKMLHYDRLSRPLFPTSSTGHQKSDCQFEEAAARYEAGKSKVRLGEDTPLREIVKNPIGRIWYEAWSTAQFGGQQGESSRIARELLPILNASQSPFVSDLCFHALRSIYRLTLEELDPVLLQEVEDAVTRFRPETGGREVSDDINQMTPQQIMRILRAKAGTPQKLNEATQAQIDATLTFGNIRSADVEEESEPQLTNSYFNFRGK